MKKTKTMAKKKKMVKAVSHGHIYIHSTFNNTIITLTDQSGNTLTWTSAGSVGFKGAKKSTPYAAQVAMRMILEKAKAFSLQSVDVYVCGVGQGREQAVRSLSNSELKVTSIKDITPVPHNGCRPRKVRRV